MDVASSPEAPDPEQDPRLLLIRQNFLSGLPRRAEEITEAPDTTLLHAALHRLAGAAGGYGYEALGDLARKAMLATQGDDSASLNKHLSQLLSEIRRLSL